MKMPNWQLFILKKIRIQSDFRVGERLLSWASRLQDIFEQTQKISMKKITTIALVFITSLPFVWSQSIFTNPITGTTPNTSNPYTTGQTVDPDITVSGIGRGTGIIGDDANDRYNARSWNTPSIDLDAYFTFTLTPNSGNEIDFVSFAYTGQASGTGPTSFAFRSSLDFFASDIGSPSAAGTTIALSSSTFQNITTSIEFRFYGWGASSSTGTFSINDFTFNGSTPLPIELISFTAFKSIGQISLLWQTASEINNDFIAIEKSTNGTTFREIGTVQGKGTSYEVNDYYFNDESPAPGLNYYRLKQVDFDGNFEYSKVVSVNFDGGKGQVKLFPTVASYEIQVRFPAPTQEAGTIQVFDQSGKLVKRVSFDSELTDFPISVEEFQRGVYFVKVQNGQLFETLRFVRQ